MIRDVIRVVAPVACQHRVVTGEDGQLTCACRQAGITDVGRHVASMVIGAAVIAGMLLPDEATRLTAERDAAVSALTRWEAPAT